MKKQFIIALAMSITAFSFAQKKELKAAEKAIKSDNFAEAKSALALVEPMLSSLDEKLKNKYNYLKGVTLYANGNGNNADVDKAIEFLNKSKSAYKGEVETLQADMVNKLLEKGNKAYEGKKFGPASEYFEKIYNLRSQDTVYLYYAAASAVNAPDYDRALVLYQKLKDLKYTGIETQYYAVNIKTNEKEIFPSQEVRDVSIKFEKTHKNPTDELTSSKRGEIVKNVALIHISKGNNDKAIQAINDAKAENPNDIGLLMSEANIYHKMGDTEKFKEVMEAATKMDPENPELQYNLGVIASDSGEAEEAMKYYKKTIELDPKYTNAYINSAALVLDKEAAIIEEMNGLGSSAADDRRYEQLREQRQSIYQEALPYLNKALELDANNKSAATTLMNIYSALGETDKYKAMKAKVEAM
ncbi:tetratricopeptide repeat protein [Flavobacteriaceae bacterium MHTCC 0001]